jgi:ubiquinone biosynthesis protein
MKKSLTSVPQIYRNLRRWTEIVSILSKYGLADWLSRFQVDFVTDLLKASDGNTQSKLNQSQRIRLALTELGPTFIKFGQLLSTRPDLVGAEVANELSKLQADLPPVEFERIRETIEQEQQRKLEDLFAYFDPEPLATASIGQVHRATVRIQRLAEPGQFPSAGLDAGWGDRVANASHSSLESPAGRPVLYPSSQPIPPPLGEQLIFSPEEVESAEVVVKVRRPGIERIIETDLDILSGLAAVATHLEDFQNYQPTEIVREIARTMRHELDFFREHNNLNQFRTLFKGDPAVLIPQPISQLCGPKMLTMQYLEGTSLRKYQPIQFPDLKPAELAKKGAEVFLKMIFEHGFYHADPHPGNILVCQGGKIGLLDFGMVGRISERLREDIEAMLVAIANQDVPLLTTLIKRVGKCPPDLNDSNLANEVADFVGQYSTQVLAHFDMSGALTDFVHLVRKNQITLPSEASLIIKVLITLEGTGKRLNPNFSLLEVMKPFQRKLVLRRLSPSHQLRKMRRFYIELEQLVDILPQRLGNILEQIQSGRFDVHLDHRRLGATANRLVMGLMTSAMFLGSSLMLSYQVKPVLFPGEGPLGFQDVSVLGISGFLASLAMGLRLTLAIRRSGNLDQKD